MTDSVCEHGCHITFFSVLLGLLACLTDGLVCTCLQYVLIKPHLPVILYQQNGPVLKHIYTISSIIFC